MPSTLHVPATGGTATYSHVTLVRVAAMGSERLLLGALCGHNTLWWTQIGMQVGAAPLPHTHPQGSSEFLSLTSGADRRLPSPVAVLSAIWGCFPAPPMTSTGPAANACPLRASVSSLTKAGATGLFLPELGRGAWAPAAPSRPLTASARGGFWEPPGPFLTSATTPFFLLPPSWLLSSESRTNKA